MCYTGARNEFNDFCCVVAVVVYWSLSLCYKILWPSIMTAAENGDMSALLGPLSALATADLTPLL